MSSPIALLYAEDYVERVHAFKQTFSSETGRLVLFHLMRYCGLLTPADVEADAIALARQAGHHDVIAFVLEQLQTSERELYDLMRSYHVRFRQPDNADEAILESSQ